MNQKNEFGSSLQGTANDIAFALETMQKAGFEIRQPVGVDLHEVACQVLGIDGDADVERLVENLAQAIDQASVSMSVPFPIGMTRPRGKFDIGTSLGLSAMQNQVTQTEPNGTLHTFISGSSGRGKPLLSMLSPEQRVALDEWSKTAPRRDGIIDLMEWPGWAEAALQKLNKSV